MDLLYLDYISIYTTLYSYYLLDLFIVDEIQSSDLIHEKFWRFILSLHKGHLSFCFSQKLMHLEWNLWEQASALTI